MRVLAHSLAASGPRFALRSGMPHCDRWYLVAARLSVVVARAANHDARRGGGAAGLTARTYRDRPQGRGALTAMALGPG
jgi:hypothetical protein